MDVEKVDLNLSDDVAATKVRNFLAKLNLSEADAKRIRDVFVSELERGMQNGLKNSCVQMENTYVGTTSTSGLGGKFLALDLGGTKFRVILLELKDGKIDREEVAYYTVEEEKRKGKGEALFDFLAECIADFVSKQSLSGQRLPLGFTFSFPMTQSALNEGFLVTWTKSFSCPGVEGEDAVKLLNSAIRRLGGDLSRNIEVVAILNDTTGTLVKGAYDAADTCIGLILGTGCNAAYLERKENVVHWGSANRDDFGQHVVIDTEMGAFGDNGCIDFIKTDFDRRVDAESIKPGSFSFEKYFAGKYIGDLLRHVLRGLHGEGLVFRGQPADALDEQGAIDTESLSDIASKASAAEALAAKLGFAPTADDVAVIRYVCDLLIRRGAHLVGITLGVLLSRAKRAKAKIAVTGSLYKGHPDLKALLEKYTNKWADGWKGETFLSDDGSGKGAGLLAAIAQQTKTG